VPPGIAQVVEPGETAIRVFISRAGRPEGKEADKEIIKAFEGASRAALRWLSDELSFIGWIDFRPATQDEPATSGGAFGTGPFFRFKGRHEACPPPDELSEQLSPVRRRRRSRQTGAESQRSETVARNRPVT